MSASMSAMCMSYACRSQRRVFNSLKLELKRVVSFHVGSGKQILSSRRAINILNVSQCLLIQCFCLLVWFWDWISQNPGWPYIGEDDLELLIWVTGVSHQLGFCGAGDYSTGWATTQPCMFFHFRSLYKTQRRKIRNVPNIQVASVSVRL